MRGVLAGLLIALIIVVVALLVALFGALGVAAIGLLLHRWFDLTQWQGSLIALVVALGVGFVAYRLASYQEPREPEWVEWEGPNDEDVANQDDTANQSPIPAWRVRRPTQGELPSERQQQKGSRRK